MTPSSSQSQSPDQRLSQRDSERTASEEEYDRYETSQDIQHDGEPDVLLDVPVIKVEEINLELDDLRAHVSLRAEVADLVKINVGVDAYLNHVKLQIKGVEAQAILKVRLERVLETLNRALEVIDHNPQILGALPEAAGRPPETTGETIGEAERTVHTDSDASDKTADTIPQESRETVDENATDLPAGSPAGSPTGQGESKATDVARKRAGELGVNLSNVKGTGSGGRVLVKDVIEAASQG